MSVSKDHPQPGPGAPLTAEREPPSPAVVSIVDHQKGVIMGSAGNRGKGAQHDHFGNHSAGAGLCVRHPDSVDDWDHPDRCRSGAHHPGRHRPRHRWSENLVLDTPIWVDYPLTGVFCLGVADAGLAHCRECLCRPTLRSRLRVDTGSASRPGDLPGRVNGRGVWSICVRLGSTVPLLRRALSAPRRR